MRLTIDLDDKTQFEKVKFKLLTLFGIIHEIYLSPSKRGYHFIVYNLPTTFEENIILREICNDDKMRIYLDRTLIKKKPSQVLWNEKGRKKAKLVYKNVTR